MVSTATIVMPENGIFICRAPKELELAPGDKCIVELDYGLDYGMVQGKAEMDETAKAAEKLPSFRVVRKITSADEPHLAENKELAEKAGAAFMLSAGHEKGRVRLLKTRFSYGRERFFIRYSAQIPVDLRRFVGQIQRDYKTHVDLWQVGVREEAGLLGCLGLCGREACCCRWQKRIPNVSIRMAREQDFSLIPTATNGTCGKLKCCLAFENAQYQEARPGMPEVGWIVACSVQNKNITARVVDRDILRGILTLRTRDDHRYVIPAKDVSVIRRGPSGRSACRVQTFSQDEEKEENENLDH